MVYRRLQRYQRDQFVILGSRGTVDIVEHVAAMDDKLANIRVAVEDLALASRDHEVSIDTCLSRVGIVRFDAYQDLGGRQSTAIAFLNGHGDGVVVSTVVSRDFARTYVKMLKEGDADIPLAPEEQEAIDKAKGNTPFTVRPRGEASAGDTLKSYEATAADKPVSMGMSGYRPLDERELARENRRRNREGLPPLNELPAPSSTGFAEPYTPSAASEDSETSESLAEAYKRARRAGGRGGKNGESPSGADAEDRGGPDGV